MEILSLGEKIKRRRKELNMTLKDLAKDRITPGQISLVESGRSNPSVDLLEYLADSLNTTVEYLMESEESQAQKISIYYERIGEACIMQNDFEKGQKYIDNALYYSEKYNLSYRKAKILFITAQAYKMKKDFPMAQKFFLSSNVIFVKNNNHEEIIETFLNLADIALELQAYHSAASYLKQAEKVYNDNNVIDDFLIGKIHYNMARTYFDIEDLDSALKYAYLAKEKLEQMYNDDEYAKNLFYLAEDFSKKGDMKNALRYSKKTLEVYRKIEHNKSQVEIERTLGKLFYELDNIDESFKHFEISRNIALYSSLNEVNETLIGICKNYLKVKDIEKCLEVLKKIESSTEQDDIDMVIQCKLIRYTISNIEEDAENAEKILLDTYELAKNNNRFTKAGELAMKLGKYYIDRKEDKQASLYLGEGIRLFEEYKNKTNK